MWPLTIQLWLSEPVAPKDSSASDDGGTAKFKENQQVSDQECGCVGEEYIWSSKEGVFRIKTALRPEINNTSDVVAFYRGLFSSVPEISQKDAKSILRIG